MNMHPITYLAQSAKSRSQTTGKQNTPKGKENTCTQFDMAGTSETPTSSMKPTEEVVMEKGATPMKLEQNPKLEVIPVKQAPNPL